MPHLLLVEDDLNLGHSLKERLQLEGYSLDVAATLQEASQKIQFSPDLIILDWTLPDGQGVDFLTQLRTKKNPIPVIFLTARADTVDKVLGLELGADDYLTKPFEPRELLARIRVQLRSRNRSEAAECLLTVGDLTIDRVRHKVIFRSQPVHLVKKEFDLLVLLAENPEKVFSREEILNRVWGYDVFPTTRTVDTHVMLLRQKIHEDLIETVRSVGYRLRPQ